MNLISPCMILNGLKICSQDDPWARKRGAANGNKKKVGKAKGAKGKGKEIKADPYADLIKNYVKTSKDEKKQSIVINNLPPTTKIEPVQSMMQQQQQNSYGPSKASVDRACQVLKNKIRKILSKISFETFFIVSVYYY